MARRRTVALWLGGWLGAWALLLGAVATRPAAATVVIEKDFAALCAEADLVFVGTVSRVEAGWRDATRQAIETAVTFSDLTWLRGTPRSSVTLRFAGGEVDGLREEIAGVPHFEVGQRGVIFAHDGDFVSPLVGFHQGLFRIVDGANGATVRDADGRPIAPASDAALRLGTPAAATGLDEFLDRVRRQLAAGTPTP